ncbi:MAG: hypothetical protein HXM93_02250 [Oribacterium parvum]|uniref:DUF4406 domain-containing protein n=1 Tax=Oribacterium parvum TaxID=1501329 RepID=A0A930DNR4_9FIRM|nr:hypothetical protein [Oribacterium parvum]
MDIYISQPMEGREKAECDKELANVATALEKEYKNKRIGFFFRTCTDDRYLKMFDFFRNVFFLGESKAVYFVDGWEKDKLCRIEREICETFNLNIIKSK